MRWTHKCTLKLLVIVYSYSVLVTTSFLYFFLPELYLKGASLHALQNDEGTISYVPTNHCAAFQFAPTDDPRIFGNHLKDRKVTYLINLGFVGLDVGRVSVSRGGEPVDEVMGRNEQEELPVYTPGAWKIIHKVPENKFQWYEEKIIESMTSVITPIECDLTIYGYTVAYERTDYANLWITLTDWFNMYLTLEHLKISHPRNILFLDGHAMGHLDDVWIKLFGTTILRLGQFEKDKKICFDKLVLMPKACPISRISNIKGCSIVPFVNKMAEAYGIQRTDLHDTIIERVPYLGHPRVNKKIDRVLTNMDEVRVAYPKAKIVRLENYSFKEQLQLIANTKTLYGVHGAGLTFGMFLRNGSTLVEWVPTTHAHLVFQSMMSWRPDCFYRRVNLNREGKGLWSLPIKTKRTSKKRKYKPKVRKTKNKVWTHLKPSLKKKKTPGRNAKTRKVKARKKLNHFFG